MIINKSNSDIFNQKCIISSALTENFQPLIEQKLVINLKLQNQL